MKLHETPSKGVWVEGLTQCYVSSAEEALNVIEVGDKCRSVAHTQVLSTLNNDEFHTKHDGFHTKNDKFHPTNDEFRTKNDGFHQMNAASSRSHSVFVLNITQRMADGARVSAKNDEFCTKNDEFCTKNDGFCTENHGL